MTSDNFIRLCRDCDLRIDTGDLEVLEREMLFYPLLRVEYPKYIQKIRRLDENRIQTFGPLEEGESWDGETREAYGSFWFAKDIAQDYFREGLLWRPQDRGFEPWKNFYKDGRKIVESYYSPFQIYPLWQIWQSTTMSLSLISWGCLDEEKLHKNAYELASWGKELKKVWAEGESRFSQAAEICISNANRYFPKTQTDRRTITVSFPAQYHNWDWYKYCRQWDPKAELAKLNIEPSRVRELQRSLASEARYIDPLGNWYSLIQFVSLDQKKKLKGNALLAQWLYAMEMMLRLFYEDLTGERLPAPDDDYHHWKERYYGQGVPERELEFLEYLTNQFHLNPRPKLILVVEGEGELDQLPRIAEAMEYPFERVGIRVELLRGIAEFTGDKRERKSGGRLTRFIDYHHQLQTLIYVILDNEARSQEVKEKLVKARSRYPESRRFVTKEEYVCIWERNFEFDNFSDSEISSALSTLAGTAEIISQDDVQNCREKFGKPGCQLEKLFQSKTGKALAKRELARLLVNGLVERVEKDVEFQPPKIVKKLEEIIHLAATNHQPTGREAWLDNQKSGFLAPVESS